MKERNINYKKTLQYYILLFILSFSIIDYDTIIYLFFNIKLEYSRITSLFIPIISLYIFLILLNRFISNILFKIVIFILLTLYIIGIIPEIIHIAVFGTPIDYISLMTLADTNKSETSDFIATYGRLDVYLKIFFIIIFPYILLFLLPKYNIQLKIKSLKFILLLLFIIISSSLTLPRDYVQREFKPIFLFNTYKQVLKDKQLFIESISKNKNKNFSDILFNGKSDNNTFILIIGESADRNRYSLYGYERDTSPYLSKIINELFIFDDVISPHAHTSPSLEKILTFGDLRNEQLKFQYGSLIDFFNSAGFKTFWISNQYKYGSYDSGYAAIANAATNQKYINTNSWQSNKTNFYDEKLLEELEACLQEYGNKFIVLHLFGSHSPYNQRYPKEFNIFKSNSLFANIDPDSEYSNIMHYNAYDNSIIYTDYVLNKAIEILKQNNINGYMLYFADHGEDAGTTDKNKFYGHNESIGTKPMFEIPFILWLSKDYRKENIEKIKLIENSIHRPYQTDRVIHTIIDLSNMNNKLFKPEDSIISENFKEVQRIYGNKKYTK